MATLTEDGDIVDTPRGTAFDSMFTIDRTADQVAAMYRELGVA